MARDDEPQRIEIELTSHDSKATRTPPEHDDDSVVTEASDLADVPVDVGRGRLIVAGSMIGLVALLLGFVLGRAGSSDDLGASTAETSTAPSATVDESLTPIETPTDFEEVEPPSTTARARQTATTVELPGPVMGSIEIDPIIAGRTMELIALNARGELTIVDVASGGTTTHETGRLNFGASGNIVAGDGWVLLPDFNGGDESTLVFDDGTHYQVETGPGWSFLMADGGEVFWRFDSEGATPSIAIETRYDGTPTGVEIDLPAPPLAADPLGGLVVWTGNGAYRVQSAGVQQLTTGQLVALGRDRMLLRECDDQLRCSYIVEERANGDRRVLEVTGVDPGGQLNAGGYFPYVAHLDVDERRLLVTTWHVIADTPPTRGMLDLETGEFIEIDVSYEFSDMQWSADGQVVLWLEGRKIQLFDPSTGNTSQFSDGLGNVVAFAVRPSG